MASNNPPSPNSNKRKRNSSEQDLGRNMKLPHTNGDSSAQDHMYVSLLQGITDNQDDPTRTAQAALQQQAQPQYPEPNVFDHAGVSGGYDDHSVGLSQAGPQHAGFGGPGTQSIIDNRAASQNKPAVGSQAWHQQRKDNHKEGK